MGLRRILSLVMTAFGALPLTKTHWVCLIGMGASARALRGLINWKDLLDARTLDWLEWKDSAKSKGLFGSDEVTLPVE
jgi:hypothetical protein